MINKKAMALEEMVKLLIAVIIIAVFVWLIIKAITPPEDETTNSFKTLGSEIKIIINDLDDTDSSHVVVPVYMGKKYFIGSVNPGSADSPKKCKGRSCVILYEKETLKVVNIIELGNAYLQQEEYIKAADDSIIKVNITGDKKYSKKFIVLEQIS